MSAEQVYLGIPTVLQQSDLYQLRSIYFPLGKIGGRPAWLNPVHVPKAEDVKCEVCDKTMAFVIQIYASGPDNPAYAFHRYLYVFVCRNGECSKANESKNMKVLRVQLPRLNPYYTSEKPLDPNLDIDVEDPSYNAETYSKLCNTCGFKATSKCAECQQVWYCSREHQVLDWKNGHKKQCKQQCKQLTSETTTNVDEVDESTVFSMSKKSKTPALNPFLFREYGLKLVVDYEPKSELADIPEGKLCNDEDDDEESDDNDEDDREETDEFKQEQQAQLETLMEKIRLDGLDDPASVNLVDTMENEKKDRYFQRFIRVVERRPDQVLRYARHSHPLRPSDHIQLAADIPDCTLCRGKRSFELQLMPHLLSLMDVDVLGAASIDWATVCIYTCFNSCDTSTKGFAQEFLSKQDFKFIASRDDN